MYYLKRMKYQRPVDREQWNDNNYIKYQLLKATRATLIQSQFNLINFI